MQHSEEQNRPEILAPAGDETSFLAALAAGADAVYAGLKHLSARMEAANFSTSQLAGLANLCRERDARLYVPMNVLLKPGEGAQAGRLLARLEREVEPHGIIVQDLGVVNLARQAGFSGEVHLSTLANLTHPAGLKMAAELGATRVVLPRELNIDEVRAMAEACPEGLSLEIFVHGALCHNISGRCWWSTSLGGKSGLRGRCVQPCRRLYRQGKAEPARLFSCQDLSLDVLTRPLLDLPQIAAWKIEGRKKGPHYVFHAVRAYKLLRDSGNDPQARKDALDLLEMALGRPTSHSVFLPQRSFVPVDPGQDTASGRFLGVLKGTGAGFGGGRQGKSKPGKSKPGPKGRPAQAAPMKGGSLYFTTRMPLAPGDLLRLGYEDEPGHRMLKVPKALPKNGRFDLKTGPGDKARPGMKIFLVDRREPGLMQALAPLKKQLAKLTPQNEPAPVAFEPAPIVPFTGRPEYGRPSSSRPASGRTERTALTVQRVLGKGKQRGAQGLWLSRKALDATPSGLAKRLWWWLPPVVWPEEEKLWADLIRGAVAKTGATFVLGAPWQRELFRSTNGLRLILGPHANPASPECLAQLADLGFAGAIVAPELSGEDFLALPRQSPLPLGVVVSGFWPLGLARFTAEAVKQRTTILSPMREGCWVKQVGANQWIFPAWELDLSKHRKELEQAGYAWFIRMDEPRPRTVPHPGRTSEFNWNLRLL